MVNKNYFVKSSELNGEAKKMFIEAIPLMELTDAIDKHEMIGFVLAVIGATVGGFTTIFLMVFILIPSLEGEILKALSNKDFIALYFFSVAAVLLSVCEFKIANKIRNKITKQLI